MKRLLLGILLSAITLLPAKGIAQNNHHIKLAANISGNPMRLALEGDYAYVAEEGFGVRVINIVDEITPVSVGFLNCPGVVSDLVVRNGIGFLACGARGIVTADFRDPASPSILGRTADIGDARSLTVIGNLLFLAAGADGFVLFSIEDPANPQHIGTCNTPNFAFAVETDGHIAYVADKVGGLQVIDVSSPDNPSVVSEFAPRVAALSFAFSEDFIYLGEASSIAKISVADPANPVRVAEVDTDNPVQAMFVQGDYLYSAQNNLIVHDIANNLNTVGSTRLAVRDLVVRGNFAFLASASAPEFEVMNIRDPRSIYHVGRFVNHLELTNVAIANNRAFVSTYPKGLKSFDVSDPSALSIAWEENSRIGIWNKCMVVSENKLYDAPLIDAAETLRIWDLSNIDAPTLSGSCRSMRYAVRGSADDGRLALSSTTYNAQIFNVEDAAHPASLAEVRTSDHGMTLDMVLNQGIAYLTTDSRSLLIKDISDIRTIHDIAVFGLRNVCADLELRGNILFACGNDGIEAIDVSNPADPVRVGEVRVNSGYAFTMQGNFAFVACRDYGCAVVDITDPTRMALTGTFRTAGEALGIAVQDSNAYVAVNDSGLVVLDCRLAMIGNQPPAWREKPDSVSVVAGDLIEFNLAAADANEDSLTITMILNGVPRAAQLEVTGEGVARFSWHTLARQMGIYRPLFVISDGLSSDTAEVIIQVLAPAAIDTDLPSVPLNVDLSAYPNPFNSTTTISYTLPATGRYSLEVVDVQGRRVIDLSERRFEAGAHHEPINFGNLPGGLYVVKLNGGGVTLSQKVINLK